MYNDGIYTQTAGSAEQTQQSGVNGVNVQQSGVNGFNVQQGYAAQAAGTTNTATQTTQTAGSGAQGSQTAGSGAQVTQSLADIFAGIRSARQANTQFPMSVGSGVFGASVIAVTPNPKPWDTYKYKATVVVQGVASNGMAYKPVYLDFSDKPGDIGRKLLREALGLPADTPSTALMGMITLVRQIEYDAHGAIVTDNWGYPTYAMAALPYSQLSARVEEAGPQAFVEKKVIDEAKHAAALAARGGVNQAFGDWTGSQNGEQKHW